MAEASSGGIGGFIGNSVGEAAAFAAGLAISPLLEPILQELRNETWTQYPTKPLDPVVVAQGAAEGKLPLLTASAEARLTGISASAFTDLVAVLKKAPGIAGGIDLIRRGQLAPSDFLTVLKRNGLEDEFVAAYQKLSTTELEPWEQPLSPADLALGLIRGNLNAQDVNGEPMFQPGGSTTGSNVPLNPVSDLDVIAEAAASGMSAERMATIARNVGLPPGVIEGLNMLNRGIINEAAFYLLIEQSDARLAWGPFLLQLRRMLLTPHEYAELYIRGWISQADMYDGTALHGLTESDSDLLAEMIGRPLAVHQVTTGEARGGTFGGNYEGVPEPYLSALRQSNVRPEWGNLAYANRYTYPSYFVIKPLVASGAITVAEATQIFENQGWPPDLAAKASASFASSGGGGTKPKVLSDATIRSLFKNDTLTEAEAVTRLEANGLTAADAALYLKA